MARLTIEDGVLTITMQGIDKVLALRGHVSVPLQHIRSVVVRPPEAYQIWHGLRVGTNLPGVVTAGTFFTGDGRVFYDVHNADNTIGITLEGETYRELVVEVDDESPEMAGTRIRAAMGLR
jgi:hypothetical protein